MRDAADLSLAYSPGVALPCQEIVSDPSKAYLYTAKGNLVAVITNGTAVLGLGNIGALASKPVMEGKAVLFKQFGHVDSIDLEIDEADPERFVEIVASLSPSFGGINLEDIKAPDCFTIEQALSSSLDIPVFHDDQHGSAIVVAAALKNATRLLGKEIASLKICASGTGAASIACLQMLLLLGAKKENIYVSDSKGLVVEDRLSSIDPWRAQFAQKADARHLSDVMSDADVYLGLSVAGALTQDMVRKMASNPIVLALSNPVPEISPELALSARPDAIICTGRSDYPNQVNNVLCFPFIFRGALDCAAFTINNAMKLAAANAIAELASKPLARCQLIPNPFDARLLPAVASQVALAAMETGVARKPISDIDAYRKSLSQMKV
ncbi:hypothetical protein E4K65_45715 [Bradyrhizobium niftali]|uniref:Malic enzyme n=2 Tax=Bradyrhizobium niftali TaxID=2560055 RepID=A0A4Y9KXW7_9BRAD|nr:hypothetical protein E4K65_45715 [Bradyrhizobium niftali]